MPHSRPRLLAIPAAALITLIAAQLAFAAQPSSSGAVSRFTDSFAVSYFDQADGLLALGGPAPEEGCFGSGFDDPADFMSVQTGSGPRKFAVHQDSLPIYVYDIRLGDPCEILFAGGVPVPAYVGTVSSVANDNDNEPSLTRTNSFGSTSTGWVEDADGTACRFSAHARLQVSREGIFRVVSEGIVIAC